MTSAAVLAQMGSNNTTFRNFIINGDMRIWQRGTSFPRSATTSAGFTADRFWIYGFGATTGTVDRSTDVPAGETFMYSYANNMDAGCPMGTNVELTAQGSAAPFVVGNTYTLSFWIKGSTAVTNLTMGINWRNSHANGTNSTQAVAAYPSYNVTTSWARVVMTFTLNASPVSSNLVLDFEGSLPAGAKTTGWQLEAGTNATPFEFRPYGTELALCQRYYENNYPIGIAPGTNISGSYDSSSLMLCSVVNGGTTGSSRARSANTTLKVPKRTSAPSTRFWDYVGNLSKMSCLDANGGISVNNISLDTYGAVVSTGQVVWFQTVTGNAAYYYGGVMWEVSAEL